MNRSIASGSFRRLVVGLEKPSPSLALPTSPYPWPDEEMMACYGLRYPTPEEKKLFPTHRLVLNVFKAKVTKIGDGSLACDIWEIFVDCLLVQFSFSV